MTSPEKFLHTRNVTIPELLEAKFSVSGHGQYVNTGYHKEGMTRWGYTSAWAAALEALTPEQIADLEPSVFFKVDKYPQGSSPSEVELASARARRYFGRGYTTINDARVLTIIQNRSKNPEKHHINRLYGFGTVELNGKKHHVSAEEFFESLTLEEKIHRDGPFTDRAEFERVFGQILEAERYLISELKILHRDPKPSNWLINDNLEIRLTDFANAAGMGDSKAKYMPTAGSHYLMRPSLIGLLTGETALYTQRDELYALGVLGMYLLTGRFQVEYSPDEIYGIRHDTGEDMLVTAPNGKTTFSVEKNNDAWTDAIKRLPRKIRRRHGKMLEGSLLLSEEDVPYQGGASE